MGGLLHQRALDAAIQSMIAAAGTKRSTESFRSYHW
jgi:hypothetical protein